LTSLKEKLIKIGANRQIALFWRFEQFGRLRSYVRHLSVRSICPRALMKSDDRDPISQLWAEAAHYESLASSCPRTCGQRPKRCGHQRDKIGRRVGEALRDLGFVRERCKRDGDPKGCVRDDYFYERGKK
jgi:hypothetical protein